MLRHSIWFFGISKFAIPSVLLTAAGARIAFRWPAAAWLSLLVHQLSGLLTALAGVLLSHFKTDDASLHRIVFGSWALGTAILVALWLMRLLKRDHLRVLPSTIQEQEALLRARDSIKPRGPIKLQLTSGDVGPMLSGIWNPVIIVPRGLSQKLTSSEFQAVLLHELAHARRFDNLTAVFVHALVCMFWFHPLLWLVEWRLSVERERACDEYVLAHGTSPAVYVASLLKVSEFLLFDAAVGVSAMTGANLKRRLGRISEVRRSASPSYVPRLLVAALIVLMAVIPIVGGYCEQCVSTSQRQLSK